MYDLIILRGTTQKSELPRTVKLAEHKPKMSKRKQVSDVTDTMIETEASDLCL